MNWEQIEGKWTELRGQLRSKWAKLTDDDMDLINGKKDVLVGRLRQRYGWQKDEAERQVDSWLGQI